MSTFEKIASAAIGILVLLVLLFSYHEIKEPPETQTGGERSDFDQSLGQDFKIGAFTEIIDEQISGGPEENCDSLQPVLIAALHDIKERLEHVVSGHTSEDAFEVNGNVLQLLCSKQATLTLADLDGNHLLLEKLPFTRAIPQGGTQADIGTRVHINATVIDRGTATSSQPTTYGEELIPDRFLDSSSPATATH